MKSAETHVFLRAKRLTEWRVLLVAVAILTVVPGCRPNPSARRNIPREQYLILAAELESTNRDNLYEAVRQLRPGWFSRVNRQRSGEEGIIVYLDDRELGDASVLKAMSSRTVTSVRYLAPTEAQVRYGQPNQGRPAILLASIKAPR